MNRTNLAALVLLPFVTSLQVACEEYDAPPEVKLIQPAVGFWTSATPLELQFSEAIDPASLVITIWPSEFDIEGNFFPGLTPILQGCSLATSPCNGLLVELNETATKATLTQNEAFADREGTPMTMEIHAGLKDPKGHSRDVPTLYDFQINPRCGNEPVDIELETGVLSLAADVKVTSRFSAWLQMFLDFAVDKEAGRFLAIATFARVNDGEANNEKDPARMRAEISSEGWAVVFSGCLLKQKNGTHFLQSDPFDLRITVVGIPVTLTGLQVQGTIEPGSDDGSRDFASGTLSAMGGSFGADEPSPIAPVTTAWEGFSVDESQIASGLPRVCEESPCAELDAASGDCQVPDGFEPGTFCN